MPSASGKIRSAERVAARFLLAYYDVWDKYFTGLNKRAHWHVIFMARCASDQGVSSRAIHRTIYGSYGTDIRTCIERIKDCEREGYIKVFDSENCECEASSTSLLGPTARLIENFDAHCRDTVAEICAVAGGTGYDPGRDIPVDERLIAEIYRFFGACDGKWRETCEQIVRKKGLTPAHFEDAMDHVITYQYWAVVMLLWSASAYGSDRVGPSALVVDEIISRMWDRLRLGHLAIKERVGNLVRWGFFAWETIKKHKAVSLTPVAGEAISAGLSDVLPLLLDLHARLASDRPIKNAGKVA